MDVLEALQIKSENSGASCGANWWSKSKDERFSSINPANGEVIASVYRASYEDYEYIVERSQAIFKKWREYPAPKRGECIRLIAEVLREKKDLLGTLVSLETGKIKQEGDGEVQEMIDMADFAVGQSRMLYGKTMQSERYRHRMFEQWHPLGTIGVITAFNFPVAVWAWNAFIAAICGDCVIWKPSTKTPLCAIAIQHICNKVMQKFDFDGVFSLFVASESLAGMIPKDKRLPLVSFTGSTAVGLGVSETVAKRLGKTILELSGNNAVIVDETADMNLAIPSIVFGAVGTAGQRCTSTRRVIVHHSKKEELCQRLMHAYQQVKIGDPLKSDTLMGPLIDEHAVKEFMATIQKIKDINGEILFGGECIAGKGYFVEPTIVLADSDWDLVKEETFAPILYILEYEKFEDAIFIHNNVPQGLSSALFTQNLNHAEYFLSAIGSDCGIANINIGTSGAEIGGAFGGEKATGGGREAGSDCWKYYMRRQTNTINWAKELPLAQDIKFEISAT